MFQSNVHTAAAALGSYTHKSTIWHNTNKWCLSALLVSQQPPYFAQWLWLICCCYRETYHKLALSRQNSIDIFLWRNTATLHTLFRTPPPHAPPTSEPPFSLAGVSLPKLGTRIRPHMSVPYETAMRWIRYNTNRLWLDCIRSDTAWRWRFLQSCAVHDGSGYTFVVSVQHMRENWVVLCNSFIASVQHSYCLYF